MLIPLKLLNQKLSLQIRGVLHVGAHECEEQKYYLEEGINNNNIFWVEAMEDKVNLMKITKPELNIYQAVIDNEDNKEVTFNIADNGQSSSILNFGTHAVHHPHVKMIDTKKMKTTKLETFIKNNRIPIEKLNFLNLDIQGKRA